MSDPVKEIASMGKVERVQFVNQQPLEQNEDPQITEEEQANLDKGLNKYGTPTATAGGELSAEEKAANVANGLNEDGSKKEPIVLNAEQKQANLDAGLNEDGSKKDAVIDDEAVLAYLNSKGKNVKSIEEIGAPAKELTPEELQKQEDTKDKKRLDWFVAHGGTVDAYAAMKMVASADLKDLSEKELENELTAQGFDEEQKKQIRAERYYQLEEEAIESLEDENEKALARKKKEFGTAKLGKKAEHKKNLAVGFFTNIDKALSEQDAEAADEIELTQKVDSHFQTVPGKITLQMGKTADNVDIAPLEMDVPADIIAEVRETLRTTDKRNNILFNKDNTINIVALSEILIRNKVLEAAANKSYLKGVSDNTAVFEETFPIRDRNAIGLGSLQGGGNNAKTKGKVASFGKSTRVTAGQSAI